MSAPFMYAIALMYVSAGVSFAWDGKLAWCGLCFSWAAGNFILGYINQ